MENKQQRLLKILSKFKQIHFDGPLTIVLGSLLVIGIIMVASTTSVVGATSHGDGFYFVKRHLTFMGVGLCLFLFGASFNHQYYKKFILPTYFISIIVLGLTLIPNIGLQLGGASRWIHLGFFQFQPIELVKFFIAVFLATSLNIKQQDIKDFIKGLCPILAIVAIPILILSNQPDLGNIILILMVTFMMLFVGKCCISHLFTFIFLGLSTVITSILLHPYQMERIAIFLDPWKDPLGRSYHIIQSYTAIGSGGILGHGFGQSKLKFFYLPLHYSDFIFAVICEEGGLILASIVLLLFGSFLYHGFRIARESTNPFSSFLAIALTLFIVLQALLNIGVVIGVFPITGIPLTFISYGGTSLIISMFCSGVLMNIAKGTK